MYTNIHTSSHGPDCEVILFKMTNHNKCLAKSAFRQEKKIKFIKLKMYIITEEWTRTQDGHRITFPHRHNIRQHMSVKRFFLKNTAVCLSFLHAHRVNNLKA